VDQTFVAQLCQRFSNRGFGHTEFFGNLSFRQDLTHLKRAIDDPVAKIFQSKLSKRFRSL